MKYSVQQRFPATAHLVEQGVFRDDPLTLIDVGCSGGIAEAWRIFGADLRAYAIDPMVDVVDRLRQAETLPGVKYFEAFIGLPPDHPVVVARGEQGPWWERFPGNHLSGPVASEALNRNAVDDDDRRALNRWSATRLTDPANRMGLDEFVRRHAIEQVDFIKIDIDGDDLMVLFSAEQLLASRQLLGFMLEVFFFGAACETDHTFHNMDRLMRGHGMSLLDLTVNRYSRSALPAPFVQGMLAETTWGAPCWGDAVYAVDATSPSPDVQAAALSPVRLLKLIAIYELHRVPDWAAELVLLHRDDLAGRVDIDRLLDLLTPDFRGKRLPYREYVDRFAQDPTWFYPPRFPFLSRVLAYARRRLRQAFTGR